MYDWYFDIENINEIVSISFKRNLRVDICPKYFLHEKLNGSLIEKKRKPIKPHSAKQRKFDYIIFVLGGWLGERFGGKRLFGYGVLCTAVLTLVTPIAARLNVYLFVFVRILEGIGEVRLQTVTNIDF